MLETNEIYLGDVDQITLTNEELGMNGTVLASCQPTNVDQLLKPPVRSRKVLTVPRWPKLGHQSYEGIGVSWLLIKCVDCTQGKHLNYCITFRKPQIS